MAVRGVNELRRAFLSFFEEKEHLVMKSFSLVPQNDKSLLLINAGMAPLKPYFTGQEVPPRRRVATCQKCIRTGDIENVGKTARHLTFFEMLGNFSFGDYFKKEAIHWSWEFLTEVLGLPADRLYPSIYGEDEEAFRIWNEEIHIPAEKITRFYRDPETGACDNFWEHGAGPCGPCSEIYYDRGEKYGCGKPTCGVGCDCDRYMEVWNNVFTQFEGDGKGNYTELSQKNIDTGMGLERLAVVMQDVDSVFDIDTMKAIRDKVSELSGKPYQVDPEDDVSIRLITDHIRSATFLVSDGVLPSNEGRGYVLRRIIRRAARHGRMLGIQGAFLAQAAETVIQECHDGYPELLERREFIHRILREEEDKFQKTLDQGLTILQGYTKELKEQGKTVLSGEHTFKLYDTFGFPVDLTAEILAESGLTYDEKGFAACMQNQRETARAARKTTNYMGADATVFEALDPSLTTEFVGYDRLEDEGGVLALASEEALVPVLSEGEEGTLVTDRTPFYATMGGQQGDVGTITLGDAEFAVQDTVKLVGGKVGHVGKVLRGSFREGDRVRLAVDRASRQAVCRNHSATHLLQAALRDVLGSHVAQAGSYQDRERTRFDFSHPSAMTSEEIARVQSEVEQKIREGLAVSTQEMTLDEARQSGATALFGEKYGDTVRVVSMGDYSKELCGGTHVGNTSDIRCFKIVSESGIAAGVRRIEALTGDNVLRYYEDMEKEFAEAAKAAKSDPSGLVQKIQHMAGEIKRLSAEVESLKSRAANDQAAGAAEKVQEIGNTKLLCLRVDGADRGALRNLSDQLAEKIGDGVVVLAGENEGKVALLVKATESAVKAGAHAGNLIKAIAGKVGGGGGGRPNMAEAGGKDPAGIDAALAEAATALKAQVGA